MMELELEPRRLELGRELHRLELLQVRAACTEEEEEEKEQVGCKLGPEVLQEVVGMRAEQEEVEEELVGNQKEKEEGGNLRGCNAPALHT